MWKCKTCETQNPENATFCIRCGAKRSTINSRLSEREKSLFELFPQLLSEFTKDDWEKLRSHLWETPNEKQWTEIDWILSCYTRNQEHEKLRCYDGHISSIQEMLGKLHSRGELERFQKIVIEIRPDLEKFIRNLELIQNQSKPVPSAPPPSAFRDRPRPSAPPPSAYREQPLPSAPPPSAFRDRPRPSAPPPAAAPAPAIGFRLVIYFLIMFLVLGAGIFLFSKILGNAKSLLATQILLLTLGVCFTPTIADRITKDKGRVVRILVETTLFIVILVIFSFWVFGKNGIGIWVVYALALTLILEIGSRLIERYSQATLNRIVRSVSYRNLLSDAESIEKMFHSELVLYVPVPVGLIAGTIIGLINNWSASAIIIFCVQLVLSLASIILVVFLINAFARMSDALFRENKPTNITKKPLKRGFWGNLGTIFRFLASPPQTNKDEQEQNDLSLAYMITDLRKVYLFDSAHNVILLVSFVFLTASLWNVSIETKWVIVALLGLGLIFGQLPYVIGQSLLHEKVLDRYDGTKRAEISEKLKKNAPLFPTVDFLAALFTTGTAGGILYFVLDQFIKNTLK